MKYLVLALVLFIPFSYSQAQNNLSTGATELTIDLNTSYPSPFTEMTATINDYSQSSQSNKIYWKIDGKSVVDFNNQREIKFATKDAGEVTNLQVFIETAGGRTFSASKVIKPIYVDIIIEPQTRTPSFFKGRSLPSIDSTINLTALINGTTAGSEQYLYNWDLNGVNLEKGSVLGKYTIPAIVPIDAYSVLTLSINKTNGELLAKRSVNIIPVEPTLYFYEVNTLYGISTIPIFSSLNLIGNSTVVRAEPYYLDIKTYNKPQHLEWKIGGSRSPSSGNNPYEVTLAKQGGSGSTNVSFHVRNLTDILQGAENDFEVKY
jgi:hypothetical protein